MNSIVYADKIIRTIKAVVKYLDLITSAQSRYHADREITRYYTNCYGNRWPFGVAPWIMHAARANLEGAEGRCVSSFTGGCLNKKKVAYQYMDHHDIDKIVRPPNLYHGNPHTRIDTGPSGVVMEISHNPAWLSNRWFPKNTFGLSL